ncbi:MAG: hypothetical protein ABL921_02360 [Pirellula sp.]
MGELDGDCVAWKTVTLQRYRLTHPFLRMLNSSPSPRITRFLSQASDEAWRDHAGEEGHDQAYA